MITEALGNFTKRSKRMENREKIAVLLKEVGVSPANLGWKYLTEAIEMVLADATTIDGLTKVLYPAIAKKYNATSSRVERAICHGIEGAFQNMPEGVKREIFGNSIRYSGGATNGEFIGTLAELITTEPNHPIWQRTK